MNAHLLTLWKLKEAVVTKLPVPRNKLLKLNPNKIFRMENLKCKPLKIRKNHISEHIPDCIKLRGAPSKMSTDSYEHLHKTVSKGIFEDINKNREKFDRDMFW